MTYNTIDNPMKKKRKEKEKEKEYTRNQKRKKKKTKQASQYLSSKMMTAHTKRNANNAMQSPEYTGLVL